MAKVDNSKIFLGGVHTDAEIKIPANTTYAVGTVLGRNSDGELVAFSTDNNTDNFTTQPLYILAQTLKNASANAATVELARVYECGAVDKNKLIFVKSADASDVTVLDALKQNGFKLEHVQELTE